MGLAPLSLIFPYLLIRLLPMHNVDGKDDCLTSILNPKPGK